MGTAGVVFDVPGSAGWMAVTMRSPVGDVGDFSPEPWPGRRVAMILNGALCILIAVEIRLAEI